MPITCFPQRCSAPSIRRAREARATLSSWSQDCVDHFRRDGACCNMATMSTLLSLLAPLCLLQSVEYRSPAGVEYRSQRDTGAIARAESASAADPRNVDKIIALGVAQSSVRQYREAIETFNHGLAIAPNNALLYRWRGHRYLSVREFDKAMQDLQRGARLDSTIYGIWYHLGIVRFVKRDFAGAAQAFTRALPI